MIIYVYCMYKFIYIVQLKNFLQHFMEVENDQTCGKGVPPR